MGNCPSMRRVDEALDRGAVHPQSLGLAGHEADAELVRPVAVAPVDLDPGRGRSEAHDLALVARPARAAGAAEVERLEQVRLAGAVRTRDHGEALAQRRLRLFVAAEIAQADAEDAHRPLTRSSESA